MGATSRLFDPDTGAEAAKFGVAQRLRFKDQRVTLPGGTPVSERLSDIMFGATLNWNPKWSLDSTVQYNPQDPALRTRDAWAAATTPATTAW